MPHVITQACCNDAACTVVCPVDCIHPRPADAAFARSEMLYIDPDVCIDCGLCAQECPVDAIHAQDRLPAALADFAALNRGYFQVHPVVPHKLQKTLAPQHQAPRPLRVAIVGTGPAGCYTAMELLEAGGAPVAVDFFERLPTPWGLIRSGVAPDHLHTKAVARQFAELLAHPRVRLHLNVDIGTQIGTAALAAHFDAVVYAVGASESRSLGIAGEHLPGSHSATEFVGWYNGHPDHAHHGFDLSGPVAVLVGNGNVALDVARVLLSDPQTLRAGSDIAPHALQALAHSQVREVQVVARRGPAHAAFTLSELMGLLQHPDFDVVVDPAELALGAAAASGTDTPFVVAEKLRLLAACGARAPVPGRRRLRLRFGLTPVQIDGAGRVASIRFTTADGAPTEVAAGLVLRSVGYRGRPLNGLPFDDTQGRLPHQAGRVLSAPDGEPLAGTYAVGWIKRGPSGVIGSNRACARETVASLLEDAREGRLAAPAHGAQDLDHLLRQHAPDRIGWRDWLRIEDHELQAGRRAGRPRVKLTSRAALLELARPATPAGAPA